MKSLALILLACIPLAGPVTAAQKNVLVVSTTLGFRHSSIETGEKILRELATASGEFTLDFASVNPRDPQYALTEEEQRQQAAERPSRGGGRGGRGGFGPGNMIAPTLLSQADKNGDQKLEKDEMTALADLWFDQLDPDKTGAVNQDQFVANLGGILAPPQAPAAGDRRGGRGGFNPSRFVGPGLFTAADADKNGSLTRAELTGTFGRWFTEWSGNSGSIALAELQEGLNAALPRPNFGGGGGGFGVNNLKVNAAITNILEAKMSPEALKNYDAVIFLNTTGVLPIPDMEGFFNWIREGHAFIGMHSASDTLHGTDGPSDYARMLGGEFEIHHAQETVDVYNEDPAHAANAQWGDSVTIHEEFYLMKNYDPGMVHSLVSMHEHPNDRTPGHYPVSWCKEFGKGRVFYTSLGHREDVWDPTWTDRDGNRENPPEVAMAVQKHMLGGILWALGLAEGDAVPQPVSVR